MPSLAEFTALKATKDQEIARIAGVVTGQAQKIRDLESAAIANEVPTAVMAAEQTLINALKAIT